MEPNCSLIVLLKTKVISKIFHKGKIAAQYKILRNTPHRSRRSHRSATSFRSMKKNLKKFSSYVNRLHRSFEIDLHAIKLEIRRIGVAKWKGNVNCVFTLIKQYVFDVEQLRESLQKAFIFLIVYLKFIKRDEFGIKIQIGSNENGKSFRFHGRRHMIILASKIAIPFVSALQSLSLIFIVFLPFWLLVIAFLIPFLVIVFVTTFTFYKSMIFLDAAITPSRSQWNQLTLTKKKAHDT